MRAIIVAAVLAVCLLAGRAEAQQPAGNAALRYWMAFAVLQDPPADAATSDLLQRVAEGAAPWDEARLGAILDANKAALEIMRRASALDACDWGLEYDLGPAAPIAHLAKARVLGRLSVLSGMRRAARGQPTEAVDDWLGAVRFSRHLAQGGTLISLLSANAILMPFVQRSRESLTRYACHPTRRASPSRR